LVVNWKDILPYWALLIIGWTLLIPLMNWLEKR
jgi:hypothetical protein